VAGPAFARLRVARLAVWGIAWLLAGLACDLPGGGSGAVAPPDPEHRLALRPCWFEYEPSDPGLAVQCAVLRVPQRWQGEPEGEVRLPVAVLRTGSRARWATLVPGGGGPGGSVGLEPDRAASTLGDLEEIALGSGGDVVVVDQRGAGLAEPAFRCEAIRAAALRWLAAAWTVEQETELWSDAAARCRVELLARGVAPDAYGAAAVALDFEALRRALGYERWNLFGTSYGGEIAQVYARSHPGAVRALVLDSPGVPGADVASPPWFEEVLGELFDRCAADEACRRDFPDLPGALARVLERLDAEPLTVSVSHPETLEPIPVVLTAPRFLDLLFEAMYDTELAHRLPLLITATDRGSRDWLIQFARGFAWSQLDARFADAMLGAVPCRESVPFGDLARIEREAAGRPWARGFVGIQRVTTEVCRAWQVGTSGDEPARAAQIEAPALLLTGRLDPVIPLPSVERAAAGFASSTLIDLPATGHGAEAWWWSCLDPLIEDFLADPERALDAQAVEACRREADTTPFATLPAPPAPLRSSPTGGPGRPRGAPGHRRAITASAKARVPSFPPTSLVFSPSRSAPSYASRMRWPASR